MSFFSTEGPSSPRARRQRARHACTGTVLASMIAVLSCGEDTTAPLPPPPPPEPSRPASLAITPSTLRLEALGDTARLVAEVRDQRGRVITGASVSWESGDPSVATVDAAGLVTATGNGTVSITASAEAASDTAAVTVNQVVGTLDVSPDSLRLEALGDTARLVAEVRDQRGRVITGASVSWESGDPSVATVDAAGLVTATGNGTVSITASAEAASDTAAVTVNQVVGTLDVSPDSLRLEALGDTARLVAEVLDQRGRVITGASVSWESGDPSVATVDAAGLVTATGNGTVSITASAEAASDTAAVTVNQVVGTLDVSPDSLRLEALGDTARLVAEVLDRRGQVVTGASVAWESGDPSVATVDAAGLVTATGNGTVSITASAEAASDTRRGDRESGRRHSRRCRPTPCGSRRSVTPARLVAEVLDRRGRVITGASVSWESGDPSVRDRGRGGPRRRDRQRHGLHHRQRGSRLRHRRGDRESGRRHPRRVARLPAARGAR